VLQIVKEPSEKAQAAEIAFLEGDRIFTMTHIPYPPETPGGVLRSAGFIPRGCAFVRMEPDGTFDEELAAKAKQLNRAFFE